MGTELPKVATLITEYIQFHQYQTFAPNFFSKPPKFLLQMFENENMLLQNNYETLDYDFQGNFTKTNWKQNRL